MNSAQAVRFVTLHFLESHKDCFDEDNYENAKILIEQTPEDKIVPKVAKLLKPFAENSEKGSLNKKYLIKNKWITDESPLSNEDIKEMGKQAEMAYSLCSAIVEMDPEKLQGIEAMAKTIQMGIEAKMEGMSNEEKENMDPATLITTALSTIDLGGEEIGSIVGSLMNTIMPETGRRKEKSDLMASFSQIDGKVAKR